jgi:hypothetical protein
MANHAATAFRLRLPCPNCDELLATSAFEAGNQVALSCLQCGYGWVEAAHVDAALEQRAARFCTEVGLIAPVPATMTLPDFPMTPGDGRVGPEN